jgi:hypothetical protein
MVQTNADKIEGEKELNNIKIEIDQELTKLLSDKEKETDQA